MLIFSTCIVDLFTLFKQLIDSGQLNIRQKERWKAIKPR